MFADDVAAADEFVSRATNSWCGHRARNHREVALTYVDKVRGMANAAVALAEQFDALATEADDIKGRLLPYEAMRGRADVTPPEEQYASRRREELSLDWIAACYRHKLLIESLCQPLETASTAELGAFEQPVVDGPTATLTIGDWARDSVDLWKLGFDSNMISMVTGNAEYSLADSIRSDSETGQSWGLWYAQDGDNGYEGGGFIVSSTGEEYPIAFPVLITADGTYTADLGPTRPGAQTVSNLGGEDEGWHVVEIQTGVERFFDDAGLLETAAASAAGSTGIWRPHPDPASLGYIRVPPAGGTPHFTEQPTALPQVSDLEWAPSSDDPLGYPSPDVVAPALPAPFPGMRPAEPVRVSNWVQLADLAPTVAAGIVGATEVNNGTHRVFQVVFEENDDGRCRANVTMYQLGYDDDDNVIIHAQHVWVGEEGALMQQPISFGDPHGSTVATLPAGDSDTPSSQLEGRDYEPGRLPGTTFP